MREWTSCEQVNMPAAPCWQMYSDYTPCSHAAGFPSLVPYVLVPVLEACHQQGGGPGALAGDFFVPTGESIESGCRITASHSRAPAKHSRKAKVAPPAPPRGRDADASACEEEKALHRALQAALGEGGEARSAALLRLRGAVVGHTLDPLGCWTVQAALQASTPREGAAILSELQGHVRRAVLSPHGNYVIQKAVEVMPVNLVGFVTSELSGIGFRLAMHRFGCRVLLRILEHSGTSDETASLMDELLTATRVQALSKNQFGHYVIIGIFEHGLDRQRQVIAQALCTDIISIAEHRNGSHVVEKALEFCGDEDRERLAAALFVDPEALAAMARSHFGSFVARVLAEFPSKEGPEALGNLSAVSEFLRTSK